MPAPRTTVTSAQAEAALRQYGSKSAAAAALGIHRQTIRKLLLEGSAITTEHAERPHDASVISIDAALEPLDVVGRVLQLVATIPAGHVMHDETVRRELDVGHARWRRVRGSARLAGHHCTLPTGTVWGSKATIRTLQERYKELL